MTKTETTYTIHCPEMHGPTKCPSLAQALVMFGKLVDRCERHLGTNLMIEWGSLARGVNIASLNDSEYVIAYPDGADPIGDAKVWLRRTE